MVLQCGVGFQPEVTGTEGGWFLLPHMHKLSFEFQEADIQAVKCGIFTRNVCFGPHSSH
jgi:hypothetical protein